MNPGYMTGCDWVSGDDCATYACGQPLPRTGGNDDDDE